MIIALIVWIVGTAIVAVWCGRTQQGDDTLLILGFWPLMLVCGLIAIPFYLLYRLGEKTKMWYDR